MYLRPDRACKKQDRLGIPMALTNHLVRGLASHASTLHGLPSWALSRHRTLKQEHLWQSLQQDSKNQRYFALKTQV